MNDFERLKKIGTLILIGIFIGTAGFLVWINLQSPAINSLTIGAGSSAGEAYLFAKAIEEIVGRHHPNLKIVVRQTKGSQENMELLQAGDIQLATVQADVEAVPSAQIVSSLYPDLFQLVVRKEAGVQTFQDLKGKKVALPSKGGGQWISFWFVANHYDLTQEDLIPSMLPNKDAIQAMIAGEVDALFRVRAAPNEQISYIINRCEATIVPIEQGPAMKLVQPALEKAIIPKGAYQGSPALPEIDIPTIAVDRLLIARNDAPLEAIRIITQVLFERRRELLQITPLAGSIRQPVREKGTFIPVHKGAQQFYDREKPPFFVENADFFALLLSLMLVVISGMVGLRSFLISRQKNKADQYTRELVSLTEDIRTSQDVQYLQEKKETLMQMLNEVVEDLNKDRVNPEGFNFFSFTWNVAFQMIKDKEKGFSSSEASSS